MKAKQKIKILESICGVKLTPFQKTLVTLLLCKENRSFKHERGFSKYETRTLSDEEVNRLIIASWREPPIQGRKL